MGKRSDPALAAQVGRLIAERRRARKLSQSKLAEAADLDPSTITRLEAGQRAPGLPVLFAIAAALRCRPRDLMP